MKLKIVSSSIAILGTALMLTACVPEVPTVPTVPTTAAPVVKTGWGSTNCGVRENVAGSVKFAKAHFRILRSMEGSTKYVTVTLNSLPFRIKDQFGDIGIEGNRIVDKLKTLKAGESAKFTDEDFDSEELGYISLEYPTTTSGVYDFYSLQLGTTNVYGSYSVTYMYLPGTETITENGYTISYIPNLQFVNYPDLTKSASGNYIGSLQAGNSSSLGDGTATSVPLMFGTDTAVNTDEGNGSLNYFDFSKRNIHTGSYYGVPSSFSVNQYVSSTNPNEKVVSGGARTNGEQISLAAFSPNNVGCVATNAKPKP